MQKFTLVNDLRGSIWDGPRRGQAVQLNKGREVFLYTVAQDKTIVSLSSDPVTVTTELIAIDSVAFGDNTNYVQP